MWQDCVSLPAPASELRRGQTKARAQAASTLEPAFRVVKVNTEASQDIASRFAIRSIPTLALFQGGVEVARQPGAVDANTIVGWARSKARLPA